MYSVKCRLVALLQVLNRAKRIHAKTGEYARKPLIRINVNANRIIMAETAKVSLKNRPCRAVAAISHTLYMYSVFKSVSVYVWLSDVIRAVEPEALQHTL